MVSSGYRPKVKLTGSAIGLHAPWKRKRSVKDDSKGYSPMC